MKKQKYTLIELLVTIAIIMILAGIAIPSTGYAIKRARMTQARADIAALVTALKSYESTYRLLPIDAIDDNILIGGGKDDPPKGEEYNGDNNGKYDMLMQILSQVKRSKGEDKTGQGNLRKIKFLDVNQKYPDKGFVDPWGRRYIIIVNSNHSGDGVTSGGGGTQGAGIKLISAVVVYSCGPNGNNDVAKKENKDKRTDDICSWDVL